MFSTPTNLGTQVADAGGSVTFAWKIDPGVAIGTHSLELSGEQSGIVTAQFSVTAATLAHAGLSTDTDQILAWAAGLIAAGLLFFLFSKPRRRRAH